MLETLITSKTRIKLLLKFFLNRSNSSYLRNLEQEFGESTNAIRVELNRFEDAGLLISHFEGNKKLYQANDKHPLFPDLQAIVQKFVGLDQLVERIVQKIGGLERLILEGSYAQGVASDVIDLVFVGSEIDTSYLLKLIEKAEPIVGRKIRYLLLKPEELKAHLDKLDYKPLLLWSE